MMDYAYAQSERRRKVTSKAKRNFRKKPEKRPRIAVRDRSG